MADKLCEELCQDVKNLILDKVKAIETCYVGVYSWNGENCRSVLLGYFKKNMREPDAHYTAVPVSHIWEKEEYPSSLKETVKGKETILWNDKMLRTIIDWWVERDVVLLYKQGGELKNMYDKQKDMIHDGCYQTYWLYWYGRYNVYENQDEDEEGIVDSPEMTEADYKNKKNAKANMNDTIFQDIKHMLG
jgi:hypothetical protein